MASEPRWRRLPEERPRQIIDAALAVFGERGLASARLDDIARRAGLSKGTIYLYFPNKEELFREVIRQTVIATIERGERLLSSGTPTEQLVAAMRGYWSFLRSPAFGTLFRLVIGELQNFPDLARFYADEVIARGLRFITTVLEHGMDAGEFRRMDPAVAARMLISMFMTHAMWCSNKRLFAHVGCEADDEVYTQLEQFYLHAICPPAGESPTPSASGAGAR
jgi:AcrR family transcriptional regulator